MSSAGFNEHTTAEEVASALQDGIKGKNSELLMANELLLDTDHPYAQY